MEEKRPQQAIPLINIGYLVADRTGTDFSESGEFEAPEDCLYMESQPLFAKKGLSSKNKEHRRRSIKIKRPYSPEFVNVNKPLRKKQKRRKKTIPNSPNNNTSADPFFCDKCQSSYIVNPLKSHSQRNFPRRVVNLETQKTLLLCNACGIATIREAQRKENPKTNKLPKNTLDEMKEVFLKEGTDYATSLAELFNEPDIKHFVCTFFRAKGCGCLRNYLFPPSNDRDELQRRVNHLLCLYREARKLSKHRDEDILTEAGLTDNSELNRKQYARRARMKNRAPRQRSKAYEDFVLKNRLYLCDELKLCESSCKKILLYSNNFLHKNTLNSGRRIKRKLGKRHNGLLLPIEELASRKCCGNFCSVVASSHSKLLESWRAAAGINQQELRGVLAEMLTPSGGKINCYKFISMVTGCSTATIAHVRKQMKETHGDRDPPEHGLKKWWRERKGEQKRHKGTGNVECSGEDININVQTETLTDTTSGPILITNIDDSREVVENAPFVHLYVTETEASSNIQGKANEGTGVSLLTTEEVERVFDTGDETIDISIPSAEELSSLDFHEASKRLQLEREKLLILQEKLITQNIVPGIIKKKIKVVGENSPLSMPIVSHSNTEALHIDAVNVEGLQPQQIHIVQIPPTDNLVSQPQISLVTPSGDSEPLLLLMNADNAKLDSSNSINIINPELSINTENHEKVHVVSWTPDNSTNESNSFQVYRVMSAAEDSSASNIVYLNY